MTTEIQNVIDANTLDVPEHLQGVYGNSRIAQWAVATLKERLLTLGLGTPSKATFAFKVRQTVVRTDGRLSKREDRIIVVHHTFLNDVAAYTSVLEKEYNPNWKLTPARALEAELNLQPVEDGSFRLEPLPGTNIMSIAQELGFVVKKMGLKTRIAFKFNDLNFEVTGASTEDSIRQDWKNKIDAQDKAYWTPERLKEKADRERRDQNAMDSHMATLKVINFADPVDVVRWLCKFETVATVHTKYDKGSILDHFAANGFTTENWPRKLGDMESSESWKLRIGKDGQVKWIVAQALDGIQKVGSPHQVIHKFAEELLGIKRGF